MAFRCFLARWQKRRPQIFWRGSTTGIHRGRPIQNVAGLQANPRVQISRVVQMDLAFSSAAEEWLKTEGISTPPVQEAVFSRYRYYPDIPGNALAWGTIFKHLRGCLVLRAPHKRASYHYRMMQPWKHYILVDPDFSDLDSAVAWAEAHPGQAAWIAWCGHLVAHRYLRQIGLHFSDAVLPHIQSLCAHQAGRWAAQS